MPRLIACADCGTKVYSGPGSLGDGKTVCRACRRKRRPPAAKPAAVPTEAACPTCGITFTPRRSTHTYCQPSCRPGNRDARPKAPAAERGYGAEHRRLRREWKAKVDAGLINCARCGQHIQPGAPWDLGHTDDRAGYNGPECQSCNRAAGGRRRHQLGSEVATDHLRWEWQECTDCGSRCYGKRCVTCHRARQRSRPVASKPGRIVSTVRFGTCERCGSTFAAKTKAKRYCSEQCMRGIPLDRPCTGGCGAEVRCPRVKCNTCIAEAKRIRKREQKRRARARSRGAPGVGSSA